MRLTRIVGAAVCAIALASVAESLHVIAMTPAAQVEPRRVVDPQRSIFDLMRKKCEIDAWRGMPREQIGFALRLMDECFDNNVPEI